MLGVELALCAHPENFPVIPGTILSLIKTRPFPHIPPLRIFFTYTDQQVHLRHIEIIQASDDSAPETARAAG